MDNHHMFHSKSKPCHPRGERRHLKSSQSLSKKALKRNRKMVAQDSMYVLKNTEKKIDLSLHQGQGLSRDQQPELPFKVEQKSIKENEPEEDLSISDIPDDVPRTIIFETPTSGRSLCSPHSSKYDPQEQSSNDNGRQKIEGIIEHRKILDALTEKLKHIEEANGHFFKNNND